MVLGVDFTTMSRYQPDGAVTIVGAWTRTGAPVIFPVGTRLPAGGPNLHTQVFQTRCAGAARHYRRGPGLGAGARARGGYPHRGGRAHQCSRAGCGAS